MLRCPCPLGVHGSIFGSNFWLQLPAKTEPVGQQWQLKWLDTCHPHRRSGLCSWFTALSPNMDQCLHLGSILKDGNGSLFFFFSLFLSPHKIHIFLKNTSQVYKPWLSFLIYVNYSSCIWKYHQTHCSTTSNSVYSSQLNIWLASIEIATPVERVTWWKSIIHLEYQHNNSV